MTFSVATPAVSITEAKALVRRLVVFAVKRRWIGLALAWVIACIGWMAIAAMPDQYVSTARIYVDTETMLQPLLKGIAFDPNVDAKIRVMKQTLLSRPNLEKLAQMTDLYVAAHLPELHSQIDEYRFVALKRMLRETGLPPYIRELIGEITRKQSS